MFNPLFPFDISLTTASRDAVWEKLSFPLQLKPLLITQCNCTSIGLCSTKKRPMARRRPAPLPHLRFLLLSDEDPSPLTQISAVETPQQLDWTSCDQLADSVYPLPPSGDDLKCWIPVSSSTIKFCRSSHSGFPCPYCWPVSGQRCGNCIFTRCQENESPTSSYSSLWDLPTVLKVPRLNHCNPRASEHTR